MRVALISDVHTNLAAWDALIRHWQTRPDTIDQIWSLGDWLGYHDHHPVHLWDRIKAGRLEALRDLLGNPAIQGVIGNHDIAVLDGGAAGSYNGTASRVISSQRRQVQFSEEWRDEIAPWLRCQPHMLSPLPGIYLAHGVFHPTQPHWMPQWYADRDLKHEQSFKELCDWLNHDPVRASNQLVAVHGWHKPLILVTGHTHQQGIWQRPPRPRLNENWPDVETARIPFERIANCAENSVALEHTVMVSLMPERPVWINPGSVGEPRDMATPTPGPNWKWARYALLEWDLAEPTQAVIHLYWLPYQLAISDQQA